jgi:hypothetical protein
LPTSAPQQETDADYNPPPPKRNKKWVNLTAPQDILGSKLIQEETVKMGLSLTQVVGLVAAFIATCGGDVNHFILSRDTASRRKATVTSAVSCEVRDDFKSRLPLSTPVLSWDEKKVTRYGESQERCAINVQMCDGTSPIHIASPLLPTGGFQDQVEIFEMEIHSKRCL